ncbi:RidA family protein [Vibrio crassostreae]|nr:RidA family protein [Vibrio crassostreae]CAK3041561.1 RidA family protein [Vibrio crassostreae]CAK3041904.1 RidA family protein [Vibrio crassostreae]CAK3044160.1 RidA family protein [Vibrio crassostreae]CAK3044267.1 RidA family protein [Vibrio crassostreae]
MIKTISPMGRYSKAKIVNGIVYLCGQFSTDLNLDVGKQSVNTFDQVDALLAECGTDKSKIVSILVHLNDIETDYKAFNTAYDSWIAGDEAPVRTCVESKMFSDQCLVELTIVATQ